ncbi:MAG: hypothetical protein NZ898_17320, partial [Myxococcota bacterium]|nr:hypothetical protein [Myxococcota bacterium]
TPAKIRPISAEIASNCRLGGGDSWGSLVLAHSEAIVRKSLGTPNPIDVRLAADRSDYDQTVLIHARMATTGNGDEVEAAHPYEIMAGVWLAHNGVCNVRHPLSDSAGLGEMIAGLAEGMSIPQAIRRAIRSVGGWGRVVVVDTRPAAANRRARVWLVGAGAGSPLYADAADPVRASIVATQPTGPATIAWPVGVLAELGVGFDGQATESQTP